MTAVCVGSETERAVRCALANKLRVVFNFVTRDWADLAPELLGELIVLARALPPDLSMAEHYQSSLVFPSADMPPLLAAFIRARSELVHAEAAAAECLLGLRFAVDARVIARRGALAALGSDPSPMFEEYLQFVVADTNCHEAHTAAFAAHRLRFGALDRLVALWSGDGVWNFNTILSLGESASAEIFWVVPAS